MLSVELRGGRQISGIRPLTQSDGATSGSRPRMPGRGTVGLVVFEEFERGVNGYWLGSIDALPYGVDQDRATESLDLHASGLGHAVTEDGTMTTRWPNGDLMIQGPGAPYLFKLRDPKYPQNKKLHDLKKLPVKNHYFLDAREGGALWGAELFGDIGFRLDAVKREMKVRLGKDTSLKLNDGTLEVKVRLAQFGQSPDHTVPVALWPETSSTLTALAHELRAVKNKLVKLEAVTRRNQIVLEALLGIYAPFLIPLLHMPAIPLPFFTKSDKSGGLSKSLGGVQVVDAASTSLYGE